MEPIDVIMDVKSWIFLGIVLGIVLGFDHPDAATILMAVLMIQMTLSLEGLKFSKDDFVTNRNGIVLGIVSCFVVNTGLTLLAGLFFIDNTALWYGWVMLASMPCAISVVTCALYMKGDVKMSVIALTAIYVVAIVLTPLMTHIFLGDAVDPLEILKYIVMFVVIPFILSQPLGRLHLKRAPKLIMINVMLFLMVFIGLGSRKDYVFQEPGVVVAIIVACVLRTFLVGFVYILLLKRSGVRRKDAVVHMVLAVWKNSGMSVSMTMALLGATIPEAVLPCVISLVVESAWFAVMSKLVERVWPPEGEHPVTA